MTPLFEKSIETLELPRVLALLAEEAATEEGRERCLALRPLSVPGDVSRLQKQTSAAFDLLVKHGTPSLSGIRPVAAALQRRGYQYDEIREALALVLEELPDEEEGEE